MPKVDFSDAYTRHSRDAETLFASNRLANADHLFGLAAECGLKSLMAKFGMELDGDRPREAEDRKHIDHLWGRYGAYLSGRELAARFVLPTPNPFSKWHVNERYELESNFTKARVEPHRDGCNQVGKLLQAARLEGLL